MTAKSNDKISEEINELKITVSKNATYIKNNKEYYVQVIETLKKLEEKIEALVKTIQDSLSNKISIQLCQERRAHICGELEGRYRSLKEEIRGVEQEQKKQGKSINTIKVNYAYWIGIATVIGSVITFLVNHYWG